MTDLAYALAVLVLSPISASAEKTTRLLAPLSTPVQEHDSAAEVFSLVAQAKGPELLSDFQQTNSATSSTPCLS